MISEIPKWCRVGYFIDAKDNMNEWCAAEVKEINKSYVSIILDGWAPKWETSVPIKSLKLAPFRKYSKGYTGPKSRSSKNWEFSIEVLQSTHEKLKSLLSGDLYCEDAFHTTQYYRGKLFLFIDNLLAQKPSAEFVAPIFSFCTDVIKLIKKWVKISSSLFPYYYQGLLHNELYLEDNNVALASTWYELMEMLKKLFCVDVRVYEFFHAMDAHPEAPRIQGNQYAFPCKRLKTALCLLDEFLRDGGTDSIIAMVRNEDEKARIPFSFLNQFSLYEMIEYFEPNSGMAFFSRFNEAVLRRIEMISESELKDLKYEEIIALINRMKKFKLSNATFNFETLKLSFFLKMLKSGYLEKRIKGLTEINNVIESLELKINNFELLKIKSIQEDLKNWLVAENILSLLLTDRPHVELMKRSGSVLKFFAKHNMLSNSNLEQLWNSIQCKHESYKRATYDIIIDLSSVLKEAQNDYLFSEFLKVPIDSYDDSFLLLIKDFTIKAISTSRHNLAHIGQQKWYGVSIFQELMLEKAPPEFQFLAIKCLVKIITEDFCFSKRIDCYHLIKRLITENNSVTQALKLFLKILKNTPRIANDDYYLDTLEEIYSLKDKVIENLSHYISNSSNSIEQSYQAQAMHVKFVQIRLQYLATVAEKSMEGLSPENFETLWSIFEKKNYRDKDHFFIWLNQGSKCRTPVGSDHIPGIFTNFFLREDKFPSACDSIYMFNCFVFFFCETNQQNNAIDLTDYRQIRYRKSTKVKGLKKILNIFLHTSSELVIDRSGRLIFALMARYEPDLLEEAEDIVTAFVNLMIEIIQKNIGLEKIVLRGLMLLHVLLDKADEDCDYNSLVYVKKGHVKDLAQIKINQNKNLRHLRKEIAKHYKERLEYTEISIGDRRFTVCDDDIDIHSLRYSYIEVEFNKEEVCEYSPFEAISHNQDVISLLFKLLSDVNKPYTDLAWQLLLTLPTCKSLKTSLRKLKSPINELIDVSSTHKLLYALKIVLKRSTDQEWVKRFTKLGGIEFILKIFTDHKVDLSVKLSAIKEEIILPLLANVVSTIEESPSFVAAVFRSYENVAKAAACGERIENESNFFNSLKKILAIVNHCSPESFIQYLQTNSMRQLLVYALIETVNTLFVENSIVIFNKMSKIRNCVSYLYAECYLLLEKAIVEGSKSSGYWDLFSKKVARAEASEKTSQLTPYLIEKLSQRPSEVNSITKDEILSGILKILRASWSKSSVIPNDYHISLLLQECLCEIPEGRHDASAPPKCKHPDTRKNGFHLLLELCRLSDQFLSKVTSTLDSFHADPSWRSSRKTDWNNSPISKEKSQTGFVGLKNLGCTCYMNSILQQLFMISTFRDSILRCPTQADEESLLYQLQYIFSGLRSSDKQYINPKGFTKTFKDGEGNSINTLEQMDVDEFFGSFMDKLETLVKNTQCEALIKLHFGGMQVTELIGKECPHRSERIEPFLSIPVEVKNKRSLQEGLESYVAEEMLEGENSYQCDHCEAKVKAIRRVCVKDLPNYLIIALRRFEFDFDTMTREKLNDYFEFPFELDMEPYTQEGLESDKDSKPKDYYVYTLRGIVIHTGTAESGHYYSYIYSGKQWIEFNDTWVCQINPESIPNDCFGGEEKFQYNAYSKITSREKYGNAYMLIYERAATYKPRNPDDESLETIDLHSPGLKEIEDSPEIKKQNQKYWRSKIIFGPEYLIFVAGLAKHQGTDSKFLIKYFVTVLVRGKERKAEIFEVFQRIEADLKKSEELAEWVLDMMCVEEVVKELFIFNPMFVVRKILVGIVKAALSKARNRARLVFVMNFIQCLKFARKKISKNYSQYLEVLKIAVFSTEDALDNHNVVLIMLNYIMNKPYMLPDREPHTHDDIYLGYDVYKSEDLYRDEGFQADIKGTSQCHTYHLLYEYRSLIPDSYVALLKQPIIMTQFINDSDCKLSHINIGKLYSFICSNDKTSTNEFLQKLIDSLRSSEINFKNKVIKILTHFLNHQDDLFIEKLQLFVDNFFQIFRMSKYTPDNEFSLNFLYKMCCKIPSIQEVINEKREMIFFIEKWIRSNMIMLFPSRNDSGVSEEHVKSNCKSILTKFEKIKNKSAFSFWDSDDELKEEQLEPNCELDFYDTIFGTWIKGKIEARAGDILYLSYAYQEENQHSFRDSQSDEVAPPDTKSKNNPLL